MSRNATCVSFSLSPGSCLIFSSGHEIHCCVPNEVCIQTSSINFSLLWDRCITSSKSMRYHNQKMTLGKSPIYNLIFPSGIFTIRTYQMP